MVMTLYKFIPLGKFLKEVTKPKPKETVPCIRLVLDGKTTDFVFTLFFSPIEMYLRFHVDRSKQKVFIYSVH